MEKEKHLVLIERKTLLKLHEDMKYGAMTSFKDNLNDFKTVIETSSENIEKLFNLFVDDISVMNVIKVEGVGKTDFNQPITLQGPMYGRIEFTPTPELIDVFTMEIVRK